MPDPKGIEASKQLVVEGKDALLFFNALVAKLGISDVQIQDFGGVSDLGDFLDALRISPGFAESVNSIGIVRDADGHPTGAFQSVCSSVRRIGWQVPTHVEAITGTDPRIGIFILPGGGRQGMLEDLLLESVAGDPAIRCVDGFITCLSTENVPPPKNIAKARVQAFLASRPKSGLLIGSAAAAGYWPWASSAFDSLKTFLGLL